MAITYSLDLATPSPAAQVAHELHGVGQATGLLDSSVTANEILGTGVVTKRGTWVRVVEANPRPWNAVITDLGFTPTVSVVFRLDKDGDVSQQQDDMVRLASGLLGRVPGDAVLHSNFEDIWLLRRDGTLSLSEQTDLWPPHRLAAVSQPYSRATHAFSQN